MCRWLFVRMLLRKATRDEDFGAAQELKAKVEGTPVQALVGPEVSRRLRLSHFKTIGT